MAQHTVGFHYSNQLSQDIACSMAILEGYFDNFPCCQLWKFCQNDNISVSTGMYISCWANLVYPVRSRRCGCLVTWFCYQLIAKPGNKAAALSWPDPSRLFICVQTKSYQCPLAMLMQWMSLGIPSGGCFRNIYGCSLISFIKITDGCG